MNKDEFEEQLGISKHLCNILYSPDELTSQKIAGITFENVSLSKTNIYKVTFNKCIFKDCLFIGTVFESVEFHNCSFENCNFFKVRFKEIYAKPKQFQNAITNSQYSNIAIHLYQQLRENYYSSSQKEFKNDAEYYFCIWKRKNDYVQAKYNNLKLHEFLPSHLMSWIYGATLGYGYKLRNLIYTTLTTIVVLIGMNHLYADYLFSTPAQKSLIKTVYFTITTMATLGASGYTPNTETGYLFVILNVITGITIFSAMINSIFKKVIR
jgi:hypothetical protein